MSRRTLSAVAALSLLVTVGMARAATVFETTDLVASTPTAAAQLPAPLEFNVTAAGNYVADLSVLPLPPAALESLSAIVTRDLQVVARLELTAGNASVQATFAGTPGPYRVHVLGRLAAGVQAAAFAVRIAPQSGGTALLDTAGTIAGDSSAPPATATLQIELNIAAAGGYELAVTDNAFPAALAAAPQVLLSQRSSSAVVTRNVGPFTISDPGTYDLTVIATAAAPSEAGLVSVRVSGGPSSVVVHSSTNPVGRLPAPIDVSLPSSSQYSLTIADASFPSPLTTLAALVAQAGAVLGQRGDAGTFPITATQGTVQVFTFAQTATVGAFSMRLAQGATRIFGDVRAVDASPAPDTPAIYSFEPATPVAAGNYRLTVHDFRFPSALPAVHAAVVQRDSIVATTDTPGTLDAALTAGPVKVIVAVEPPPGTATQPNSALFGVDLSAVQGANVFESTQGVGGLFKSHVVPVPADGRYEFTVADLEFPEALGASALAVTRGTDLTVQIFGGTNVSRQLAAGTYVLNFIGQPGAGQLHGSYGLKIADAPPAPAVTLNANPNAITSGDRTTLTWTATNATTCIAANGWTGSKSAAGGTEQSAALSSNATFELSCSGPGGTGNASASVTVSARSTGSGGGGGSSGLLVLIYMSVLAGARVMIMSRRRNVAVMPLH